MTELNLSALATETRNENTLRLDEMSALEIITVMSREDANVIGAVRKVLPQIAQVITCATKSLQQAGRIVYIGAGTSGRLGVLDAVECPPTFGVDYNTVVGIMAGGEKAFVKAKEGVEDDATQGALDLQANSLTKNDIVIGLAASGRTPYVIGALKYAKQVGCTTASIACNPNAQVSAVVDYPIEVVTGPEILTGSTRLKAGTAEKIVLNMISTASMIGIGKVYGNLMVDVRQSNRKLAVRAENIVMQATGCNHQQAVDALAEASGSAKLAIAKMLLGTDLVTAQKCLDLSGGKIKTALKNFE